MISTTERTDTRRARREGIDAAQLAPQVPTAHLNDGSVRHARAIADTKYRRAGLGLITPNERHEATARYTSSAGRRGCDSRCGYARSAATRPTPSSSKHGSGCRRPNREAPRIASANRRASTPCVRCARNFRRRRAQTLREEAEDLNKMFEARPSRTHTGRPARGSRARRCAPRDSSQEYDEAIRIRKQALALTAPDRFGVPGGRIARRGTSDLSSARSAARIRSC